MSAPDLPDIYAAVVGQEQAVARLRAAADRPVHAYLFVGPAGSGKRRAARAFGASIVADHGLDGSLDSRAVRLALSGQHPDVREFEREGAAISMGQVHEIVRAAMFAPVEAVRKVLVIDEVHLVRPEAAAALLKTLEEPPASTVFVVLADEVTPEMITIASRCLRVDFAPVPAALVEETLRAEGADVIAASLAAAASAGDLDRARLLASDPTLAARYDAWKSVPARLDGAGATVALVVDELLGGIEAAQLPLVARQAAEVAALAARSERYGDRAVGRQDAKALDDRHKRELRRHRVDELRFGLAALAGAYRDRLASGHGSDHDRAADAAAVDAISSLLGELVRNPNETLQLQALLLQLSQ